MRNGLPVFLSIISVVFLIGITYMYFNPTNTENITIIYKTKIPLNESEKKKLLNLNTATFEQLTCLPKIGKKSAKAIIDYREKNNGFDDVYELLEIIEISSEAFDAIIDLVTV